MALEGDGVWIGVYIFWVLTQSSVCVEEVGREHRCEAKLGGLEGPTFMWNNGTQGL